MKKMIGLIAVALILAGLPDQAAWGKDLTRDEVRRCMDFGYDIMRAEERLELGERAQRDINRRLNGTTNRDYQRQLTRDYNKEVRKQSRRIENYEDYLLPRFNKDCARRSVQTSDYERVCNTQDRMENPFCRSFPDLANRVKRKKGWK
ncbi:MULTISPECIES: hypothetical protein [Kordiimonas]|jgi:hypothetical protein|uniref:hypothetical protein n=1 Tax=Kordiimonas TaxID=288021 RepID=UPI00257AB62E|nr:hypothetical protein [Kordiimonas sp. UBA4487]